MPPESSAVTVKLNAVPGVALLGAATESWDAGPTATAIELEDPLMAFTASFTLIDWLAAVISVIEKLPTPLVSLESAGRTALGSLLVKCTVPA